MAEHAEQNGAPMTTETPEQFERRKVMGQAIWLGDNGLSSKECDVIARHALAGLEHQGWTIVRIDTGAPS